MALPRSAEPAPRELSTDDLAQLRRVIEPLRQWLHQAHGRRGLRDGVLGMTSVAIGLVGLGVFDVSPLVALLHIILALATEGFGARLAMQRTQTEAARPFVSPLHALAFVETAIAALRPRSLGARVPRIEARNLPHAWVTTEDASARSADAPPVGRRPRLPPILGGLLGICGVMAIFALPLLQAASTLFDRWDWMCLSALLAVNAAQLWSAWHDTRRTAPDLPWDRDWSAEPPTFGYLMFWKHYRLVPLFWSFVLLIILVSMGSAALDDDRFGFARTLEARLEPMVILLFVVSGALHVLLLAAPWQARRKIAAIDAFDLAAADHVLKLVAWR